MKQHEIIEMARQAGMIADGEMWFSPSYENCDVHIAELEAFAKLVAAKERDEWAKEFAGLGEWTAVHILEARGEA